MMRASWITRPLKPFEFEPSSRFKPAIVLRKSSRRWAFPEVAYTNGLLVTVLVVGTHFGPDRSWDALGRSQDAR